ncbi:hypothetical protein RJ492_005330 [Pluralibacter gergoviae]|uniref:Lipoprotein n=1 Tax=Pluralibacter gergoviae TaxID=61647 RepID=A0AAI9DRA1_PLUGE|nr:hypothetical protein [Pluralibacter gergoviae]EKV9910528.1 hypothetical protein [Pluralibacter gergoviae]EKW7276533.1 hypothetical protein [Pluralibacter gergoviae]ELD4298458.1 hypothetical protein [Pluralibacter gergoviae]ELD4309232.1 hypothetical protein [Pluralibacter gergoviae]
MKALIIALSVLSLTGCATSATDPAKAKLAPKDRVYSYQEPIDNGATLTVIRDHGMLGAGCYYGFYINKKRAASLSTSERADFKLPAGEWMLGFKGEGKLCIADDFINEREVVLKPGQHKGVRLSADPSGNLDIRPISL